MLKGKNSRKVQIFPSFDLQICNKNRSLTQNATLGNYSANDGVAFNVFDQRINSPSREDGSHCTHFGHFSLKCDWFCCKFGILLDLQFNGFRRCRICIYDCSGRVRIILFHDRRNSNAASNWWHFHELVDNLQKS